MDTQTGRTVYMAYETIKKLHGKISADLWLEKECTDGERVLMEKFEKQLAKDRSCNWHVQPFTHL